MAEITSIDVPPDTSKHVSITVDVRKPGGQLRLTVAMSPPKQQQQQHQRQQQQKQEYVQVFEVKEKQHAINYSPPAPGIYTFDIKYQDEEANGSPLKLNLGPPNGKLASISRPPTGKIRAGQTVDILFNNFAAGRGEFTASCRGQETGDVRVFIQREGITNDFSIKFLPPKNDVYVLSVFYSGTPLKGSPYSIDLIPVRADMVKCSNLSFPEDGKGPVEMDICTEGCGKAKLTSSCTNNAGEHFPVKIKMVSKDNYHLVVDQPHENDSLTLDVMYGRKHVRGSPFHFTVTDEVEVDILLGPGLGAPPSVADPDKVKLGELHKPETAGRGKQVWIDVDCSDAGPDAVTAQCAYREKPVKVAVEELGNAPANYKVKFDANEHGKYKMSLFFGGKKIPRGSFEIDVPQSPDPTRVKLGDLHVPNLVGSEEAWIDVDCSEAGHGKLEATCTRKSDNTSVNVAILDLQTCYKAKFTPEHPDIYTLSLTFSGEQIPGGSFEVAIPSPDPTKLKLGDLHSPEFAGKEHAWVDVDCSKAGYGTLTATCKRYGEKESDVDVTTQERVPGRTNRVEFIPNHAGHYVLSIYYNGVAVPEGTFDMEILPKPDLTKVKLGELHAPKYAGEELVWINVDCTSAGHGELNAKCTAGSEATVDVSIEDLSPKGKHRVQFIPSKPDVYTLSTLFAGEAIPGGSFKVNILEKPDPTKVKFGKLSAPEYAGDESAWIDIDCSNAGDGILTAECMLKHGRSKVDVLVKALDSSGCYQAEFVPAVPGIYSLLLLFNGEAIPQATFEVIVLQRPDPSKVRLGDLHAPKYVDGKHVWIDVDCSEAGHGMLAAECTKNRQRIQLGVSVEDLSVERSHRVRFTPTSPDLYTFNLYFGGIAVPDGLFNVNILPRPDPAKVKLGDLHAPKFVGDGDVWIDVDTSDAGDGSLTAECSASYDRNAPVSLEEFGGQQRVKFTPLHSDTYTLSLFFSGEAIPGGTYQVNISDKVNPAMVKLGSIHIPEFAGEDDIVWVDVDASRAGPGRLEAECYREKTGSPVGVTIEEVDARGDYRVQFSPRIPAVYTLSLLYDKQQVPGGFYEMNIFAKPDATKVSLGPLHVPESASEGMVWIDVDCSQAGNGELKAVVMGRRGEKTTKIIPELLDSKDNYRVQFSPKQPDIYDLSLLFDTEHVPNGSFEINLLPKSCAKMVRHLGTFIPDDIGEPVVLKFDASKAGAGEVRGRVTGVTQAGMVSSRVDLIDEENVIYHLFFIPEGADTYNVDVYWSDESIPGSPIYVKIVYPNEVILSDVAHSQDVYQPIQLFANTQAAGPGVLTASCSGTKTGRHSTTVTQDHSIPTKSSISVQPTLPDLYCIQVYFNDIEVKQSPVEIDLRPLPAPPSPELVNEHILVAPMGVGDLNYQLPDMASDSNDDKDNEREVEVKPTSKLQMYVGEPMSLMIDGVYGKLSATAYGEQTGESAISIHSEDSRTGTYQVKFQPNQPDTYRVGVSLQGKYIAGSPYIINYLERETEDILIMPQNFGGEQRYRINVGGYESEEDGGSKTSMPTRMQMFVGDPVTLLVENTEGEIGDLAAFAEGERTGNCEVSVDAIKEKGSFRIMFNPDEADTYTIVVQYFSSHIPGSPFVVEYREREEDHSETEKSSSPTIGEHDLQKYTSSEEAESADFKSLDTIVAVDEQVPEHPIYKPYLIKCVGFHKDLSGVLAYAIHDDTCIRDILRIRKRKGKKSVLVFYPQRLGLHYIHVKYGSNEITGSPFKLKIIKGECRLVSIPDKAYVNDLTEIKIDASEAGEGDLNILATVPVGGKGTSFNHTEDGHGLYSIFFTPKVPGRHKIAVKWAGRAISDFPISVQVMEPSEDVRESIEVASKVSVIKNNDKLIPSDMTYFQVNTEKAGKGELTIKSTGPLNPRIKITKAREGLYSCNVQPIVSGRFEILILWNGIPIPGNPYKIDFITDKTYLISDLDLEAESLLIGQPHEFFVHCGSNEGTLAVTATPTESASINVSPTEENTYLVKIIPLLPGNHEIFIKFADTNILQSPYYVQFEAADRPMTDGQMSRLSDLNIELNSTTVSNMAIPSESLEQLTNLDLSKVKAKGPGLLNGVIGQEGNFTIDLGSPGEGNLEVKIKGPKGSFMAKLRRHPDKKRVLLARYDPTQVGEYTIGILWCNKHVEGSPFTVNVKKQEQIIN